MKIIFLNTENGKYAKEIELYINNHKNDTDTFCFQEAYENMQQIAFRLLPNYIVTKDFKKKEDDEFSQATYIKDNIKIIFSNIILKESLNTGFGIHTKVEVNKELYNIFNFHGKAYPGSKLDDDDRIIQSNEIIKHFKNIKEPIIIGGDFNLDLNTKSVSMFEENGYNNLIKEHNIKTTRNRHAWEKYPSNPQYYADYVFVSPNLNVKKFIVEQNEISDHLPLIVEI